jgi:hypothetical protein
MPAKKAKAKASSKTPAKAKVVAEQPKPKKKAGAASKPRKRRSAAAAAAAEEEEAPSFMSKFVGGIADYIKNLPVPVAGIPMSAEQRARAFGVSENGTPRITPGEFRGENHEIRPQAGTQEAFVRWLFDGLADGKWDLAALTTNGIDAFVMNQFYSYIRSTSIGKTLLGGQVYGEDALPSPSFNGPPNALLNAAMRGGPSEYDPQPPGGPNGPRPPAGPNTAPGEMFFPRPQGFPRPPPPPGQMFPRPLPPYATRPGFVPSSSSGEPPSAAMGSSFAFP